MPKLVPISASDPEGNIVKRWALNMRTTREARSRLEAAAALSGRSLSAEVEYRLDRSFRDDDVRNLLREALGDYGDAPNHKEAT